MLTTSVRWRKKWKRDIKSLRQSVLFSMMKNRDGMYGACINFLRTTHHCWAFNFFEKLLINVSLCLSLVFQRFTYRDWVCLLPIFFFIDWQQMSYVTWNWVKSYESNTVLPYRCCNATHHLSGGLRNMFVSELRVLTPEHTVLTKKLPSSACIC